MKRHPRAIVALLVLSVSGCSAAGTEGGDPKQVSEAFAAAYNARDLARLGSLYADDAELMPPDSPPIKGRAAIEALFKEQFEQNCTMELASAASEFSGSQGFDTGRIAVTMNAPDGTSQTVSGRYLAVLKRAGNEWRIVYHMQTIAPE